MSNPTPEGTIPEILDLKRMREELDAMLVAAFRLRLSKEHLQRIALTLLGQYDNNVVFRHITSQNHRMYKRG